VSLFLRLIIGGVVDTGNKLITGVMESIKIAGVNDTGNKHKVANISESLWKNTK
jgi:hypothetical protein